MDKNTKINSSKWGNLGFQNHLNSLIMEEKIDSWCIKVTNENRKFVESFFGKGYIFRTGAYYGINKETGRYGGYRVSSFSNYFDYEITTEEFYQKIGLIKELVVEIW